MPECVGHVASSVDEGLLSRRWKKRDQTEKSRTSRQDAGVRSKALRVMMTEHRNAARAMPPGPPAPGSHTPVSDLLVAWRHGDKAALGQLLPIVHAELRRLAVHMARENPGHTLQPTRSSTRSICGSLTFDACTGRTAPSSLPLPPS